VVLSIGAVVDERYTVERALGEGGFGEAYLAVDHVTGQTVVVKLAHVGVAGDLAAFNRYLREVNIGERLDHPGIQRLLRTGRGRQPYMVLEYVDGSSLRAYLNARGPLPVDDSLGIARQLADILCYVHQQGVVHRDLKPENILITPEGRVKLTDFGIALRLGARQLTFSHLANAIGTPDYMAPEQVRGERGDARIDVYALGVVLCEMLTGRVPYPSEDVSEAIRQKAATEPPLCGGDALTSRPPSKRSSTARCGGRPPNALRVDGRPAPRPRPPRRGHDSGLPPGCPAAATSWRSPALADYHRDTARGVRGSRRLGCASRPFAWRRRAPLTIWPWDAGSHRVDGPPLVCSAPQC
jgi:serine/threonine-protein kinase